MSEPLPIESISIPSDEIPNFFARLDHPAFTTLYKEILNHARKHGFDGFNGFCAQAGIAINDCFFGGKATYTLSLNQALAEHKFYVGHLAVEARDTLWDAHGETNEWDVRLFADLSTSEDDYREIAEEYNEEYDEIFDDTTVEEGITNEDLDPFLFADKDRRDEFRDILQASIVHVLQGRGLSVVIKEQASLTEQQS